MGSGFLKKKKQARMLQEQFSQFSQKLEDIEANGSAGGGLVEVTLNGNYRLKSLSIKPDCIDPEDVEGLETLIKAAFNNACDNLTNNVESQTGALPAFFGG